MVSIPLSFSSCSRCTAVAWAACSSHSADVFSISGLSTKTCSCMRVEPRSVASDRPPHRVDLRHARIPLPPVPDRRRSSTAGPGRRRSGSYRRPACAVRLHRTRCNPCVSTATRSRCRTPPPGSGRCSRTTTGGPTTPHGAAGRGDLPGRRGPQRPPAPGHLQDAVRPGGTALELVTDVEPERGYTYTMISSKSGQRPDRPCPARAARRRTGPAFRFDERYNLTTWPWRWFEGPIYRFINKNNEDSMRRASAMADRPPRVPGGPGRLLTEGPRTSLHRKVAGPGTERRRQVTGIGQRAGA